MPDAAAKIKILLVEDEALIAEDEARQLEEAGYSVAVIGTGEKAVDFVRAHPDLTDLILMDINLGKGMDGTQAAREILKDHDIPVIFLSVYTDKETVEKTEKVSSYGYVVKTSGIAVLSASIRIAINLHRALRELQRAEVVTGPEDDLEGIVEEAVRRPRKQPTPAPADSLLRTALEAMADGIMVAGREGNISGYNAEFVRLWGLSKEALEGKTSEEALALLADRLVDPGGFRESIRQTNESPEAAGFELLRLKDGRTLERYSRPHVLDGRLVGRVCSFRDVTGRMRTEDALRDSEERYRIVSSLATDYFFRIVFGADGQAEMDMVSENFPSITGRTLEDAAQLDRWVNFIHPDDYGRVLDLLGRLQSEGGEADLECRSYVQGGQERWVHVAARAVAPPGDTRPSMIIGAVKDITERKQLEAELRESQRLLDEAQTISKTGGWEYDVSTKRIKWTDEVYRIHGVDRTLDIDDIEYNLTFYEPEGRKRVGRAFAEAVNDGRPYDLEEEFIAADGTPKWVRTKGRPVVKDGRVMKVVGNIVDITDRKRTEEALRESHRLLDEAQKIAKVGGWEFDLERKKATWTKEMFAIFGLGASSDPSDVAAAIGLFVPEDRPIISEAFQAAVEQKRPFDVELRMQSADGNFKWIRATCTPMAPEEGPAKLVGLIQDVTDRRLMEEELRRTVREKEILMKEVQHRVKNSLSVVSSLLGLDSDSLPDDRSRKIFADVRSRIQAISIIYDQMVRLNDPGKVDLRDLIVRMAGLIFKSYVSGPGRFALKTDLDDVFLDTKRAVPLALIINELIVNAVKYSHPAGDAGEIRLGLHETDGRIELRVEDDGVGFPEKMDPGAAESTGLVLIRLLAGQLDGDLTFGRGRGAGVILQFSRDRAG